MALMCTSALNGQNTSALAGCPSVQPANFRSINQGEVDQLIRDVAALNPKVIEAFKADPELKQAQLENLRELLAFASLAIKDGLAAIAKEPFTGALAEAPSS